VRIERSRKGRELWRFVRVYACMCKRKTGEGVYREIDSETESQFQPKDSGG
jgi:hypothetical protein